MIPKNVEIILDELNKAGYEAYIVGGAVRDYILKKEPKDWDITTSATPDKVKEIFNKTIDTGLKHGTVTAMMDGVGYEITTFRIDGNYSDGRHPDKILYTTNLEEDLKRRDLTINAMAMDKNENIIDIFGGIKDLEDGIIRTVGNPNDRINEDALRMLRAIRFSAVLDSVLDENLYNAIKENKELIKNVSWERIEAEITKILLSDNPERLLDIYNLGLMEYIMPEFEQMVDCKQVNPHHKYDVALHTLSATKQIEKDKILRYTMLFHDIGKPDCKTTKDGIDHFYNHPYRSVEIAKPILERFRLPRKDIDEILSLIKNHDKHITKESKTRRFLANHTDEYIERLKKVQLADVAAQSDYLRDEKIENINKFFDKVNEFKETEGRITKKDLKINGNDLLSIGFRGPAIGDEIDRLYDIVLSDPTFNDYDKLIKSATRQFEKVNDFER